VGKKNGKYGFLVFFFFVDDMYVSTISGQPVIGT